LLSPAPQRRRVRRERWRSAQRRNERPEL